MKKRKKRLHLQLFCTQKKYLFQCPCGRIPSFFLSMSSTITALPSIFITYLFTLPYTCILRAKTLCSTQVEPMPTIWILQVNQKENQKRKNVSDHCQKKMETKKNVFNKQKIYVWCETNKGLTDALTFSILQSLVFLQ